MQIVVSPENISVGVNDTLVLACVAYGDPIPSVGWSREGQRLINDSRSQVTIYENQVTVMELSFSKTILEICSFEAPDSGQYSCDASNQATNASVSFVVSGTLCLIISSWLAQICYLDAGVRTYSEQIVKTHNVLQTTCV